MWSVLSGDFDKNISPRQCLFHSLQAVKGDIIVFHDNLKAQENMLYALPRFLEHFTSKGFRFSTLKNQFAD
jgi:peptidoglycan/xylan/chitin deacetylase (PgdA/CDA1 family)